MINEDVEKCQICKGFYPYSQLTYHKRPFIDIRQFLPPILYCQECLYALDTYLLQFWEKHYGLQDNGYMVTS